MNINRILFEYASDLCLLMNKTSYKASAEEIAGIIKLHAKLAVGAAWIPIIGLDVAASVAALGGMYARINNKLGITIGDNVIKTIATGVVTNYIPYLCGATGMTVLKFTPGIGPIIGLIVFSGSNFMTTITSGIAYMKALTSLKEKGEIINGDTIVEALCEERRNR